MKKKILFGTSFLVALFPLISLGAPSMIFEENKNQWPSQVLFQTDLRGGYLWLEKNTFTYQFNEPVDFHDHHRNPDDPISMKYHVFKVNFLNSNPNVEISGNNLQPGHRNYYRGNDPRTWAEKVQLYTQVYYKEIYEGIDINLYSTEHNLKYDLIVHAGANPKNIRMKYDGADKMHIEYGHLYIKTCVGTIIEQKPYAYQEINGEKKEIPCSYVLKNNTLSFSVGEYDASLPLIIDPTLIASTYTGSTADNWGYTATYDLAGNIYTGGIAAAQGYPTSVGAHDVTFNGGMANNPAASSYPFDIVLTKFNPTGTALMFSTYYGGSLNEQPHSLIVNNNYELFVAGRTNSANFPTTLGAFDQSQNGGYDIIVGKFNANGALLASTFVGGTGDDCVNVSTSWTSYSATKYNYADDGRSEIILDANSDVYVAACSRSSNFPITAGAYDNAIGGAQDGVVFKMNSTLTTLVFSTYLGGGSVDAAYGLKLDNSNNVYVTGGTNSTNFPTTAGVILPAAPGGTADGFIAVLNNTGTSLLRATYLGTTAYDQSYFLEIDASGDIYVFGQTRGAYPVTPGVYSNANSSQFIHKVSGLLNSTVFSTVIGSGSLNPNISPTAFLVDSCQSIYISGWGRCSVFGHPNPNTVIGMPVTPNAFQTSSLNGCNFYFAVLTPNAKSLWYATYFGEQNAAAEDHVDGGTSRFDSRAFIYQSVCANCGKTPSGWPTTSNAYSTTNNSITPQANCNNAVVKMDVQVKPLAVVAATTPTSGCAPLTVSFVNTGSVGADFVWDFGDGSPIDTITSPTHTYSTVGTYTLTLYAVDSIGICGWADTATAVITVGAPPALTSAATNILCNGGVGSATVTATGGMNPLTYNWNPTGQTTPVATGLPAGNYTVTVTDALGCSSVSSVTVTEPPALTLGTSTQGASCGISNGSATASAGGGTPGYTYAWSNGDTNANATGLAAGTYTVTVTDANGCSQTATANVTTANGPTVATSTMSNVLCNGGNTGSASATPFGGTPPYTYQWSPSNQTNQNATGLTAGTYTVVVTDVNNCTVVGTVTISEPPALITSVSSGTIACNGGVTSATVTASGGTPGYTYAWGTTPVQTSPTATGLAAGSYSVLITDGNGCTSVQNISLTQPLALNVSATSSGAGCGTSSTGSASASVTGGVSPYTYLWSNSQTTSAVSNLPSGNYGIIITDANGCTSTATVTIVAAVQPTAAFTVDSAYSCEGIVYQFTDQSSQATTVVYNFGDGTSSTQQNPIHTFPYNGTYTVSLIATNPPCKDTAYAVVSIGDMSNYGKVGAANIFTPNADGANDCFYPALTGPGADTLKHCFYVEVFDRWGVKMFETDNANNYCWDGNNQQNGKPAVDGTYYYIAKLGKTTIKGHVALVRQKN